MTLETDADRLAMLQAVGEQVTLAGASVWALWSSPYAETLGVSTRAPAVLVREIDAAGVSQSSQLVRAGITYRVAAVEPDGTGMVTLQLIRAS
jgi:hypothetical protein